MSCLVKFFLFLSFFQILDEIEEHNIKIYHLPDAESDEDEDFKEQTRLLKVRTPLQVPVTPVPCHQRLGRSWQRATSLKADF